jgi:dolichol-phosphate mannosyltransferase
VADFLSEEPLPVDAGDFRLIDRCVLDALQRLDDVQPYLRGAIAAMGFEQVGVEYERSARASGESKFSYRHLVGLSLDGILNHSTVPLRIATYTGFTISALTILGIVGYAIARAWLGQDWPAGFATTTALILLSLGVNALFLGVIGEYLGRIYKQVKRGPNTIVERAIDSAAGPALAADRPEL